MVFDTTKTDKEFLQWIHDRIVNVYRESENVDFLHRLRAVIEESETEETEEQAYTRIYKQTQELAIMIACFDGFAPVEGETIDHNSTGRGANWWSMAVAIQEFMNCHEMKDIVEGYIELADYSEPFVIFEDREMNKSTLIVHEADYFYITPKSDEDTRYLYHLMSEGIKKVRTVKFMGGEDVQTLRLELRGVNCETQEFKFEIVSRRIHTRGV